MKNVRCLQGQCYEIFDPYLRCSTWVTFEQAKTVSRNFSFPEDIRLADTQFLNSIQIKTFCCSYHKFLFFKSKIIYRHRVSENNNATRFLRLSSQKQNIYIASPGTSRYSYSLCTTALYSTARYSYSRYSENKNWYIDHVCCFFAQYSYSRYLYRFFVISNIF